MNRGFHSQQQTKMGSFRLNTWANCYTYIPSHLFLGEVPQDTYLNTENWAKLRCHCYGPTATFGFLGSGHVKLGSGQVKLVMHMACEEGGAAPCPLDMYSNLIILSITLLGAIMNNSITFLGPQLECFFLEGRAAAAFPSQRRSSNCL